MRRRLDALLVLPPMYHSGRTPDYNPKEPMGLMYLAAELRRRGLTVDILDADLQALTIEETVGEIATRDAAVIGFSVLQRALPSLRLIVEGLRARRVGSHVCCGGVGATLSAVHILQRLSGVDSIVLGDGELTFADLVGRVVAGEDWRSLPGLCYRDHWAVNFTRRADKPDLDLLAPPVRDVLPVCLEKTGYATVVGSRGCYAACKFCSNSGYERAMCGPGWRGRDPVSIVDEIELLHREYGVTAVKFNDPNLFGPGRRGREHVERLCREIISRGLDRLHLMAFTRASDLDPASCRSLRAAGFERMLVGIESFDERTLERLRKGETVRQIENGLRCLTEAGISIVPGFIIFNPYSTLDTLRHDLDMLERYGFAVTLAKSMRIFDGTDLRQAMHDEGRLRRRSPFDGYHEYAVGRDVAAVYMSLKTLALEWLDPLSRRYQDRLWEIKKAGSFVGRQRFYSLQDMRFSIESRLLRAAVSWIEQGGSMADVRRVLEDCEAEMSILERSIGSAVTVGSADRSRLSAAALAESIHTILKDRPYDSFPEKYRWADD